MSKQLSQYELYGEVLSSEEQYRKDIAQVPRYTKADEAAFVERARSGDEQARHNLILSRIGYITFLARKYANISQAHPHRVEFLDLVQLGNLTALERLDKALASPNPIGYLNKAVAGAMIDYARIQISSIPTGKHHNGERMPVIYVESLDAPPPASGDSGHREYEEAFVDRLVAETCLPQPEEDYEPLYQAIETLPEKHREVIKRHYGFGCAPETLNRIGIDILRASGRDMSRVRSGHAPKYERSALKQLKRALEPVYVVGVGV